MQEFSSTGEYIRQFDNEPGAGNGQSSEPWGIATNPATGNLYVSEFANNRVQEFSPEGNFITTFGAAGSGPGQFSHPEGLAISSSGTIYIADSANNRVQEWAPGEPPTSTVSLAATNKRRQAGLAECCGGGLERRTSGSLKVPRTGCSSSTRSANI